MIFMPGVSIVLPSYNGEKYIRTSIDSILCQTYLDWELLIVDDCSTDETPKIINEYCQKDSRISVIRNTVNQKLPVSLNIGFKQAKGKYLTWTSDDNMFEKDAIRVMVDFLDKHQDYVMVCCDMKYINESGMFIKNFQADPSNIWKYNSIGACFMYTRIVKDIVGEYDKSLFLVEDYDYWIRIYKEGKIGKIENKMYQYRHHKCSLTESRQNEIKKSIVQMKMKYLPDFLKKMRSNRVGLMALFAELYLVNPEKTIKIRKCFEDAGLMDIDMQKVINLKKKIPNDEKKIIIFGSGIYGERAVKQFENRVRYIVDNNPEKVGSIWKGKEIISFDDLLKIYVDYHIVISVNISIAFTIVKQLEEADVKKYFLYEWLRDE